MDEVCEERGVRRRISYASRREGIVPLSLRSVAHRRGRPWLSSATIPNILNRVSGWACSLVSLVYSLSLSATVIIPSDRGYALLKLRPRCSFSSSFLFDSRTLRTLAAQARARGNLDCAVFCTRPVFSRIANEPGCCAPKSSTSPTSRMSGERHDNKMSMLL